MPFVLAGVIAAIAGLALTIAHIDKDFEEAKQNLIRVGELYAAAAVALIAFGLLFPVYDSLAQPSGPSLTPPPGWLKLGKFIPNSFSSASWKNVV